MVYLDSSGALKLVIAEAESPALRNFMATQTAWAISDIGRTEVLRGAVRHDALAGARELLSQAIFIEVTSAVLERAAELQPPTLRTLDAIHIASALSIRADIEALVTYDARMGEAAASYGLTVMSPGA